MGATVLERIAGWASGVPADWSALAVARTVAAVRDTLACCVAGQGDAAARAVRAGLEGVPGPCSLVGQVTKGTAEAAALANGTAAHALDYDDNFQPAITHASAVLVPALLALAEARGAGGAQLIDAYIVGLECQAAVGRGVNSSHYVAGWHATSTVGAIGTAAGCGRLLGLDAAACAQAMSLATSMAAGGKAQFGSMAKPLHAGLAARNAVQAARLAEAGLCGNLDVLEHPMGFLSLYGGDFPRGWEPALAALGAPPAIEGVGLKPKRHPCCGAAHNSLDMLLELRREIGFTADEVAQVTARLPASNVRNLAFAAPQDGMQARFSLHYAVAVALLEGRLGLADFTPAAVADPRRRALLPLTRLVALPPEAEADPDRRPPHQLTLRLKDGRELRRERIQPRGSLAEPFAPAEEREKLLDCTVGVMGEAAARDLLALLDRLDGLESLEPLTALLRFNDGPNAIAGERDGSDSKS